jgi:hypothetical protein
MFIPPVFTVVTVRSAQQTPAEPLIAGVVDALIASGVSPESSHELKITSEKRRRINTPVFFLLVVIELFFLGNFYDPKILGSLMLFNTIKVVD